MTSKKPLSEVTTFISRGISPKYDESGYVVINQRCIRDQRVDFSSARYSSREKTSVMPEKLVRQWDGLVNSTGVGTLGRVAQILRPVNSTIIDSHVTIVRPNLGQVDGRYFGYALFDIEKYIETLGIGATGQTELSRGRLSEVEIAVPSLPTQRKIAAILSAYDDLIENNLRRIKILEEMAQNLYREWFVKFRFPGHQHARFTDSPLGKIPEGWKVKRLDQVALFQNNGTEAGEHLKERIYLPIDCIPRKSLAITETNSWTEAQSSLHLFEEGDILFGAMRPYFHKVVVAPFKGVTRKTCFVFKSALPEYHTFTALLLFQESTVSFANAHSKGATIPYAVCPQSRMECLLLCHQLNKQNDLKIPSDP